ncbi:MAG TPA: gamma-glutamyl-gamma-aminobutyrate hydrolase family protein [Thermoanaerobaculia bacterium]|nr:gamma-glutamyl-gamma-aminobutyrate hydrolase family protein [Thermoanaerobaculia bacterium]
MRIALTLDRDAVGRERNDYVTSLLGAGFRREEIEVLGPGGRPSGPLDGLVLGGGCDVEPARYGEALLPGAGVETDPERDVLDFSLLAEARRDGVPVLAICRGLQVVNVALGGTLIQDVPTERRSPILHDVPESEKTRLEHPVSVEPGTRLSAIAPAAELPVNSRHHQAIARPAAELVVSAVAPDGVVEAAETPDGPWLVGVQWHPENLAAAGETASRRLFSEFARAVRERAAETVSGREQRSQASAVRSR